MNNIIDNNREIIDNIREIYSIAPAHKLRELIEKHFIPTNEEKKRNAEVSTPVKLVDEMLDKMPIDFWKTPQKVFEPCCGKGNFVLGIFDRFYKGLDFLPSFPLRHSLCILRVFCVYSAFFALKGGCVFLRGRVFHCSFLPSFPLRHSLCILRVFCVYSAFFALKVVSIFRRVFFLFFTFISFKAFSVYSACIL